MFLRNRNNGRYSSHSIFCQPIVKILGPEVQQYSVYHYYPWLRKLEYIHMRISMQSALWYLAKKDAFFFNIYAIKVCNVIMKGTSHSLNLKRSGMILKCVLSLVLAHLLLLQNTIIYLNATVLKWSSVTCRQVAAGGSISKCPSGVRSQHDSPDTHKSCQDGVCNIEQEKTFQCKKWKSAVVAKHTKVSQLDWFKFSDLYTNISYEISYFHY